MTLRIQDDPAGELPRQLQELKSISYTFNRDINPQSIKTTAYAHAGYRCEGSETYCDHAEIVFATHSEAPLIDEHSNSKTAGK